MIPGGYGFEVLKFGDNDIREIARLPQDVRVVCALSDLPQYAGPNCPADWHAPGPRLRPIYLLICHRYCIRTPPGCPYQFTELDEFLSRYAALAIEERQALPDVGELMARGAHVATEAWFRDGSGQLAEYVWSDKTGWVRRWAR